MIDRTGRFRATDTGLELSVQKNAVDASLVDVTIEAATVATVRIDQDRLAELISFLQELVVVPEP